MEQRTVIIVGAAVALVLALALIGHGQLGGSGSEPERAEPVPAAESGPTLPPETKKELEGVATELQQELDDLTVDLEDLDEMGTDTSLDGLEADLLEASK